MLKQVHTIPQATGSQSDLTPATDRWRCSSSQRSASPLSVPDGPLLCRGPARTSLSLSSSWAKVGSRPRTTTNIAFRSWLVLSKYPPLLGQYSQVSQGHKNVYDLGPLLYWFLTIPVHIDPRHGMLWGGALVAVTGLVLAVKAAWSFGGERTGSVVTVLILAYLAVSPPAVLDPAWNVNIGITYLIVTGVTGWAVSNGKLRWLPFLVLAASFDCQCHLIFVLPTLGDRHRVSGLWAPTWFVQKAGKWSEVYMAAGVSIAVGIAVWVAPILQQIRNDPGNMTLLLRSTSGGAAAKAGFTLGAQTVGSSIITHTSRG